MHFSGWLGYTSKTDKDASPWRAYIFEKQGGGGSHQWGINIIIKLYSTLEGDMWHGKEGRAKRINSVSRLGATHTFEQNDQGGPRYQGEEGDGGVMAWRWGSELCRYLDELCFGQREDPVPKEGGSVRDRFRKERRPLWLKQSEQGESHRKQGQKGLLGRPWRVLEPSLGFGFCSPWVGIRSLEQSFEQGQDMIWTAFWKDFSYYHTGNKGVDGKGRSQSRRRRLLWFQWKSHGLGRLEAAQAVRHSYLSVLLQRRGSPISWWIWRVDENSQTFLWDFHPEPSEGWSCHYLMRERVPGEPAGEGGSQEGSWDEGYILYPSGDAIRQWERGIEDREHGQSFQEGLLQRRAEKRGWGSQGKQDQEKKKNFFVIWGK